MRTTRRVPVAAVLAVLLAAAALALAGPGAATGLAQTPSPSPTAATEDSPVEVTVSTLAPRFLSDPDAFFRVAGRLTNTGSATVRDLRLRLMVGERLQSRGDLAQADDEPPAMSPVARTVPLDDVLAPRTSVAFDITVRVDQLDLGRIGVYPFGVRVRGSVDGEEGPTQVGLVQTYLPWFPDGPPEPTRIAWLWPLADQPRRAPREVMVDEELTRSVASGGRLSQLVVGAAAGGAGKCDDPVRPPADARATASPRPCTPVPVPVTYAVDPDLLFSVNALTSDYDVLERDRAVTRPGSEDARRWLASFRQELELARTDLLVLPYADPDLVALARDADLDADIGAAANLGARVIQELLGQTSVLEGAWPPPGPFSQAALDASLGPGTASVLLDETALPPPTGARSHTPDARAALSTYVRRDVTGLVIDDALSRLLEPGPATTGMGPRLAEQRWLVETAMVVAEAPSRTRTLVVAPPRRGGVPQAVAAHVIADTGRVPWLCPVSLRDVVAGRDACPGERVPSEPRSAEVKGALETPDEATPVLAQAYLDVVDEVRRASDQFTDHVLNPGDEATRTKTRLLRARLRAESSAWRTDGTDARRMLSLLREDVQSLREQVTVQVGSKVTLTSDKGTIRVNLQNALNQRVTVRVRLTAPAARLSVETTPEVELEPRTVKPVDLEVEALVSGQFVVEARLLDRQMQPFGESTRLVVRSTRYGRLALALTGLGAAGLLVAAGVRIVRRALRKTPETDPEPAA